MNAELGGPMRDHEERVIDAAMACCPDVGLPGHHPDNCRVCRDIAAALRSAEESAARRCAEIAAPPHGEGCGYPCNLCATCKCIRAAIRSEFGLGEEG